VNPHNFERRCCIRRNWSLMPRLRESKFPRSSFGENKIHSPGETMASESLAYCDDGHLEMVDTATHWVQHEQPARVNTVVSQFFA
jgi:pimeloyl-ACP methyl ester carboxylesterase